MKKNKEQSLIIGIDEVGRGPLAGPVAVGAFILLEPDMIRKSRIFQGVKESKQLSPDARERWFSVIEKAKRNGSINFHVAFKSHSLIDKKGIVHTINAALSEAIHAVAAGVSSDECMVLLDGGLKAPVQFTRQKTIIRGDAKKMEIALASICAKVLRDRHMVKVAEKYPGYDFHIHKGYGTEAHRRAIRKEGFSSIHRLTFCKNLQRRRI